jgi:hypothetical protein
MFSPTARRLSASQLTFLPTRGTMKNIVIVVVLCAAIASFPAFADHALNGKDAAYIDWSANNCGVASTDKAHVMVDQARAKNEKEFMRVWTSESYRLLEMPSSPAKIETMCSQIKEWYGPVGTRFSDLIGWKRDSASDSKARPASGASEGRKGKGRSGQ